MLTQKSSGFGWDIGQHPGRSFITAAMVAGYSPPETKVTFIHMAW